MSGPPHRRPAAAAAAAYGRYADEALPTVGVGGGLVPVAPAALAPALAASPAAVASAAAPLALGLPSALPPSHLLARAPLESVPLASLAAQEELLRLRSERRSALEAELAARTARNRLLEAERARELRDLELRQWEEARRLEAQRREMRLGGLREAWLGELGGRLEGGGGPEDPMESARLRNLEALRRADAEADARARVRRALLEEAESRMARGRGLPAAEGGGEGYGALSAAVAAASSAVPTASAWDRAALAEAELDRVAAARERARREAELEARREVAARARERALQLSAHPLAVEARDIERRLALLRERQALDLARQREVAAEVEALRSERSRRVEERRAMEEAELRAVAAARGESTGQATGELAGQGTAAVGGSGVEASVAAAGVGGKQQWQDDPARRLLRLQRPAGDDDDRSDLEWRTESARRLLAEARMRIEERGSQRQTDDDDRYDLERRAEVARRLLVQQLVEQRQLVGIGLLAEERSRDDTAREEHQFESYDATATKGAENVMDCAAGPAAPSTVNAQPTADEARRPSTRDILARFLTVVVTRVPEIAPAVADLLPDNGDYDEGRGKASSSPPRGDFPHVVDATLAELRSLAERCEHEEAAEGGTDARRADLKARVTRCIEAIVPYRDERTMDPGRSSMPGGPTAAMGGAGAAWARPPPPAPSFDPAGCRPLVPNRSVGPAAAAGGGHAVVGAPRAAEACIDLCSLEPSETLEGRAAARTRPSNSDGPERVAGDGEGGNPGVLNVGAPSGGFVVDVGDGENPEDPGAGDGLAEIPDDRFADPEAPSAIDGMANMAVVRGVSLTTSEMADRLRAENEAKPKALQRGKGKTDKGKEDCEGTTAGPVPAPALSSYMEVQAKVAAKPPAKRPLVDAATKPPGAVPSSTPKETGSKAKIARMAGAKGEKKKKKKVAGKNARRDKNKAELTSTEAKLGTENKNHGAKHPLSLALLPPPTLGDASKKVSKKVGAYVGKKKPGANELAKSDKMAEADSKLAPRGTKTEAPRQEMVQHALFSGGFEASPSRGKTPGQSKSQKPRGGPSSTAKKEDAEERPGPKKKKQRTGSSASASKRGRKNPTGAKKVKAKAPSGPTAAAEGRAIRLGKAADDAADSVAEEGGRKGREDDAAGLLLGLFRR